MATEKILTIIGEIMHYLDDPKVAKDKSKDSVFKKQQTATNKANKD